MINYLKDIKKETLIGQLPDIINSNNESIRNEFNWIFDSSLNRLTKSVYAPTGSVKSHFGEFVNLACEYFTVKNTDSIKASIQDSVESIINETLNVSSMQIVMAALTNIANSSFIDPKQYDISALCDISTLIVNHNVLNNRLKDIDFIDDDKHDFCHDAASIVYEKENGQYVTVKDVLDNINNASLDEVYDIVKHCDASLDEVYDIVKHCDASLDEVYDIVKHCDASIEEFADNIQYCVNSVDEFREDIGQYNTSINNLENSVNDINSNIEIINSSVNTLKNNTVSLNASVNNLDASVNDLYTRIKLPIVRQSGNATISPNVYNIWDSINNHVTISKGAATDTDYVNEYIIKINNYMSGQIVFTGWNTLKWAKGEQPSFIGSHAYEISIIDNFASYIEYY